jgi:hypothetical protein
MTGAIDSFAFFRMIGSNLALTIACAAALYGAAGCTTFRAQSPPSNPIFVQAANQELVWERSVDVLHRYLFNIERENRLAGVIETTYKTGAGIIEPWHPDSVTFVDRIESTFQSIRRKAFIQVTPAEGGYFVEVRAFKELEDVANAPTFAGAATFLDNNALPPPDFSVLVGQAAPSGWIAKGRDPHLEQALLVSLSKAFSR